MKQTSSLHIRGILTLTALIIIQAAFAQSGKKLLSYYDGKVKLDQQEVLALSHDVISTNPSDYLVALAHFQIGLQHRKANRYYQSFDTYSKALHHLSIADTIDHYLKFSCLRNQGATLMYLGFVKEAVNKNQEALASAYAYSTYSGLSVKHNLGMAYSRFDEENAVRVFQEIISEADELLVGETTESNRKKIADRKARTYDELGKMFLRSQDYPTAISYFQHSIRFAKSDRIKSRALHNLSQVYLHYDSLNKQQQFLEKALALKKGSDRFLSLMDLGESLILSDREDEAQEYLNQALVHYTDMPLRAENIKVYELLSEVSADSARYFRIAMREYKSLAQQQTQVQELLKQEGMKQLLLKLEAEEQGAKVATFWQRWAMTGGILALIVALAWYFWLRHFKRGIADGMKRVYADAFK